MMVGMFASGSDGELSCSIGTEQYAVHRTSSNTVIRRYVKRIIHAEQEFSLSARELHQPLLEDMTHR